MADQKNILKDEMIDDYVADNPELSLWEALIPIIALVALLAYNVFIFEDNSLSGSNQFILLIGGAIAAIVGFKNKVSYEQMMEEVGKNLKSTTSAFIILLLVGALAASWLVSGIIPTMVFYGLKLLSPSVFFPATVIICAIISVATGSSWTTTATVGIALVGIGQVLGLSPGMVAGAVISGAYFGDKMSPLSDTTNLAAAMAGAELFSHIRYMLLTTVPSIVITLIIFTILGFTTSPEGAADVSQISAVIDKYFNTSLLLFLVPIIVIAMIIRKTKPIIALLIGTLLGGVFAIIFQPEVLKSIVGVETLDFNATYMAVMIAFTEGHVMEAANGELTQIMIDSNLLEKGGEAKLFKSGGMAGMLGTIWLIVCALVFGGIMDAIGALSRISQALLSVAKSTFSLFASTVASCLAINVAASDQYLAIVIPGKMYGKAFEEKGLAPENLSRTLEDSGTVTSVLIPWNTCGAYQSTTLGVSVGEYFFYAIFNYISPFMTLIYAAFYIKIKTLKK